MKSEDTECTYLSWLARCKIPAGKLFALMQEYGSGESVYRSVKEQDSMIKDLLDDAQYRRLKRLSGKEEMKALYSLITGNGIRAITSLNPLFPEVLTQISDPVTILFYQGQPEILKRRSAAMIGSRKASVTGLKTARTISRDLSVMGISVVSGFAYGIDTASHEGCLEGKAPTVAVMGCGLDRTYPTENAPLRKKILDRGGLLISEFSPGEPPLPYHFPYRNRIISAVCDAVVLIEARIRSGSLTTVSHALDQGKEIFVFPGEPGSSYFEGNHQLLREGARYFTSARDIAEDMNWLDNPADEVQNIDCSGLPEPQSETEKRILDILESGPKSFDQLSAMCSISAADLMGTLTMLQIRGAVESIPGKKYRIIRGK